MSNTYTWALQSAPLVSKSIDGLTNVIREVHWCVTATDEKTETSAYRYGGPVQLGAPSPAAFTAFEKTTLADVVGWYQEVLGKEQIEALTKSMDDEIEAQIKADADLSTPVPMALAGA